MEGEKSKLLSLKASFCTWLTCTSPARRIRIVLSFDMIPVVYDSMYLLKKQKNDNNNQCNRNADCN